MRKAWLIKRACRPTLVVPHVTLDFGLRRQGCHGVYHDNVNGRRTDQLVGYFQCLLPRCPAVKSQIVHVHAQLGGIKAVEGVFRIDKRGYPAGFLRLGDGMDGQGRFLPELSGP